MISVESQVLQRHLSFLQHKSLCFAGALNDDFPQQLAKSGQYVQILSSYFDYVRQQTEATFGMEFQLDRTPDLLVYYWSKNKQEVQFQLLQLLSQAQTGQEMLVIGENRCGVRSAEKLLAPYGELYKMDSARRCGLYHFRLQKTPVFALESFYKSYQPASLQGLQIFSLPGVFSASELDQGTALLLSSFNQPLQGKVLDMGCGAGVIGCFLKQQNPVIDLCMVDIHAMALASAERSLQANQLTGQVLASDVFSEVQGKFDLIVSNPPFHDGIDTAYRAVSELIAQAKQYLNKGGELRLVANAFLPYPDLLDQHFGSHQVLAQTGKFKVYSVRA